MLFNSSEFLLFLPVVFSIYWMIAHKWRWLFLLVASYFFYYCYNPWFCLLLLGTSLIDYYAAKQIAVSQKKKKRLWLLLSISANLSVLVVFKYSVFFVNSYLQVSNRLLNTNYDLLSQFIIPAGLSFYTFQSMSYTIDVYKGKYLPKDHFGYFALYVSFFPHMVAGPVVRYSSLMPQFYEKHKFARIEWGNALRLILWGFFKKMVIADRLGDIVSPVFGQVNDFSGSTLLFSGFLFVVQVYCDLSGYSDIATGVAKLFGIQFSLNWRRPLLSRSLIEFWQRNHISITTWFRDYLYISLGGNRVSKQRWLSNIFLVFLISALWHGANWTFIIWGSMHGVVYLVELLNQQRFKPLKAPPLLGWVYLLVFHTFSLIAFRAMSVEDLGSIYYKIAFAFNANNFLIELRRVSDVFPLLVSLFFVLLLFLKELNEEQVWINRWKFYHSFWKPAAYVTFFLLLFVFGKFNANSFIYFQF